MSQNIVNIAVKLISFLFVDMDKTKTQFQEHKKQVLHRAHSKQHLRQELRTASKVAPLIKTVHSGYKR
ncbi:hypothetical protein HNY73_010907 [Argiope bruennichi]|uniref:Uncharacterized protein n=1 Tax=Argiope bruennichi TaxID=94029 RepID=A0A8T0F2H6_ARGBR|nr:hypothetical protein HNY73_010907 [Argiope bruennichi]